jgi:CubicO group peptidase (beta-lactamase class C family)
MEGVKGLTLTQGQAFRLGGMLRTVANELRARVVESCTASGVPGYLAGVYHAGQETLVSHGVANLTTRAPMCDDTGFLFGSITKVMTAALVLQLVERGLVDLEERVVAYVPEFKLTTRGAAEEVRVRHLLTHTNGIDADLFLPNATGPEALRLYVERLGQECGALFSPGEYMSYSNGGMLVAGRLLEVATGMPYNELLERELFAPAGMNDSCTSAEQAILRSTAVGHFPGARRTDLFKLPDSWASAGSTPIGTIHDLLAFAQTHLALGQSSSGKRVLSRETTGRMESVAFDMHTVNVPPIGLGWLLVPFGATSALSMSGASPGGVAVLVVVPEHDFAFAAYGNDPRAMALHDQNLLWLLTDYLAVNVPDIVPAATPIKNLEQYAGTYRSNQQRVDVRVVDGQLEETATYEQMDAEQERIFNAFSGGGYPFPPRRCVPVQADLFAPAGMPLDAFNGYSRMQLVSYHGGNIYRCAGGRMTRRAAQ